MQAPPTKRLRGGENGTMTLEEQRGNRSPTKWLTAAFWLLTVVFVYILLGFLDWWTALVYTGAGVTLTYFWWKKCRRSGSSVLFGLTCSSFAALTLVTSGVAVLAPLSAPVDSVGPRRVVCGSVINQVQTDELSVTTVGSSDSALQSWPEVSQTSLQRTCSDRLDYRGSRAAGLTLVGLLLAARATGHLIAPANSRTGNAKIRQT